MEPATKHDDVRAPCRLACQPEGGFHGFTAGVGKRHPIHVLWQVRIEPVGERQHVGMLHGGVLGVNQLGDLFLGGGDHFGVAVPGGRDANTGGEVQPAIAVLVVKPATFAALCTNTTGLYQQGGKMTHGASFLSRLG